MTEGTNKAPENTKKQRNNSLPEITLTLTINVDDVKT